MNLQEGLYRRMLGETVFMTWHEAVYHAINKKLWGKVVIVKEGNIGYVIKNKEEK